MPWGRLVRIVELVLALVSIGFLLDYVMGSHSTDSQMISLYCALAAVVLALLQAVVGWCLA